LWGFANARVIAAMTLLDSSMVVTKIMCVYDTVKAGLYKCKDKKNENLTQNQLMAAYTFCNIFHVLYPIICYRGRDTCPYETKTTLLINLDHRQCRLLPIQMVTFAIKLSTRLRFRTRMTTQIFVEKECRVEAMTQK